MMVPSGELATAAHGSLQRLFEKGSHAPSSPAVGRAITDLLNHLQRAATETLLKPSTSQRSQRERVSQRHWRNSPWPFVPAPPIGTSGW